VSNRIGEKPDTTHVASRCARDRLLESRSMSASGLGRILIVDDEESVRDVLAEYFTEHGYDVVTAESGTQALASLPDYRPDLVLLDIRMPGLDGIETLRRLRQVAPAVAVIMVTANEDVALARDTLKIGALDYVAKPFDFAYLEQSVMAGLVSAGVRQPAPSDDDPWRALAHATFRVVRGMAEAARASTGVRLEDAALRAAREAAGGRRKAAAEALGEVELLLAVAGELRDLTGADLAAVQSAVVDARRG
jgi:two-component system, response regulator, stage 0 sporulation protein F